MTLSRLNRLARPVDPDKATIERFVRRFASTLPAGAKVLDAGAGDAPYRRYFEHTAYFASDLAVSGYHAFRAIDLVGDLSALPVDDASFDAVLCTQVLEHVPDPEKVLRELYRVLRNDGVLALTVPQSWEIHEPPHDYFRFTRYGLGHLLERAGFTDAAIQPRGGYFLFIAERIRHLPEYFRPRRPGPAAFGNVAVRAFLEVLFGRVLPTILAPLDTLDTSKTETLGYECVARKRVTTRPRMRPPVS